MINNKRTRREGEGARQNCAILSAEEEERELGYRNGRPIDIRELVDDNLLSFGVGYENHEFGRRTHESIIKWMKSIPVQPPAKLKHDAGFDGMALLNTASARRINMWGFHNAKEIRVFLDAVNVVRHFDVDNSHVKSVNRAIVLAFWGDAYYRTAKVIDYHNPPPPHVAACVLRVKYYSAKETEEQKAAGAVESAGVGGHHNYNNHSSANTRWVPSSLVVIKEGFTSAEQIIPTNLVMCLDPKCLDTPDADYNIYFKGVVLTVKGEFVTILRLVDDKEFTVNYALLYKAPKLLPHIKF